MNSLTKSIALIGAATLLPILANATTFWGVSTNNELVTFNAQNPVLISESYAISGLKNLGATDDDPYAAIINLARSAFDGKLYGVDTNANFYQIASNGIATFVNSFSPTGYDAGFDFDSFTNGFRFLNDVAENFDIAADGVATQVANSAYGFGDVNESEAFQSVALGIDPIFGEAFSIDAALDTLSQSYDPDFAEFYTLGDLGVDITGLASLTVNSSTGALYGALSEDAFSSSLYKIDTFSGKASLISKIGDDGFGNGIGISAITVRSVPSHLNTASALFAGMLALVVIRRRSSKN